MSMKTYPIEHDEVYAFFANEMRKERVAISKQDAKTKYICSINGIHPVAVVGWMEMSPGHVRLKTDYVRKAFRGQGVYSDLFMSRLILIFTTLKPSILTAYCTPMSLPKYLAEGFEAQSVSNGITYVKRTISNTDEELQRLERRVSQRIPQINQPSKDNGLDSAAQGV